MGGRTVYEAKQNLSFKEAKLWFAYASRFGSLNIARRLEQELASIKLMLSRKLGNHDSDIWDFMQHEEAPVLTFADEMKRYKDELE